MNTIPLNDILAHHAARHGDRVAYRIGDVALGWRELEARASGYAAGLVAHGVGHDDLVALSLPNGPEFTACCFAIWRCGATPLPLSPKLPAHEREAILALGAPRLLIAEAHVSHGGTARVAPGDLAEGDVATIEPRPATTHWKACTSGGSTGRPKIIVDHRPGAFDPAASFLSLPQDGVMLNTAPSYHNGPFSAYTIALFKGCTVIDMPRFDAEEVLRLVERHRVQWIYLVPTMMHRIWQLGDDVRARYDLSSLEMIVHTAGPIPRWLKQGWIDWLGPARVGEVYGATEGLARIWIAGDEWLARPGAVGKVSGGAAVRIQDEQGNSLGAGAVGEVYLMPAGGPGSTYHYLGAQPRRTADGWESVGDLGWLDDDGYLYLADRRDDMIISGGVNIYPAEVEAALLRHHQVASAAVIGLKDDEFGQRIHAVVERRDASLDADALTAFLREHLVLAKVPRGIEFVDGPVRDDAGKVRRSALRAVREA